MFRVKGIIIIILSRVNNIIIIIFIILYTLFTEFLIANTIIHTING